MAADFALEISNPRLWKYLEAITDTCCGRLNPHHYPRNSWCRNAYIVGVICKRLKRLVGVKGLDIGWDYSRKCRARCKSHIVFGSCCSQRFSMGALHSTKLTSVIIFIRCISGKFWGTTLSSLPLLYQALFVSFLSLLAFTLASKANIDTLSILQERTLRFSLGLLSHLHRALWQNHISYT